MIVFRTAPKLAALVACVLGMMLGVILNSSFSHLSLSLKGAQLTIDKQVLENSKILVEPENTTRTLNDSFVNRSELKPINNTAWCPTAVCRNSDICRPCDRKFLILITAGRSGSTTLTYMMDSLPGVRMSGENNNELKALKDMVDNIRDNKNFQNGAGLRGPWGHNKVPGGAFACPVQKMIETINPPVMRNGHTLEDDSATIVGFKTIRFVRESPKAQDKQMVDFVKEMFPCSRIIVNIRSDTVSLMKSRQKAFGKTPALPVVEDETQRLRMVAEMFGDSARLIDSTEWLTDISKLNEILTWLGFDRSCWFTELLEFNTGGGYGTGRTKLQLDPKCKYLGNV